MKLSDSDAITYVICAAGQGERFVRHGFTKAKPILNLKGITMLERSLQSLEITDADQLIIISQKKHQLKSFFSNKIKASWIELEDFTGGQLATFMHARDLIQNEHIVIFNCDTYFESPDLRKEILSGNFDGLIPCSQEPGDAWSFCKVDRDNNVIQVTEKKRISQWASVGYYYFHGKNLLMTLAEKEIENVSTKESYVAPLYEKYLELGLKIKMIEVVKFLPFGTMEQVRDYWGIEVHELISENE